MDRLHAGEVPVVEDVPGCVGDRVQDPADRQLAEEARLHEPDRGERVLDYVVLEPRQPRDGRLVGLEVGRGVRLLVPPKQEGVEGCAEEE